MSRRLPGTRSLSDRIASAAESLDVIEIGRGGADAGAAVAAPELRAADLASPRAPEKRLRSAVGNLGVYAVCLGVVPDAKDRAAVAAMMAACFPSLMREEIDRTVGVTA